TSVVLNRPMHSPAIDTINNDDRLGATIAIEHLIQLGHRHIWHIDGGRGAGAAQRRTGYETTKRKHGSHRDVLAGAFTESSGVKAAQWALGSGRPVTAIFAGNDL